MSEEPVFRRDGSTYVSPTKIVLGGTTYATANITSVSKRYSPPNTGCAAVLILCAIIGLLIAALFWRQEKGVAIAVGVFFLVLGIVAVLSYRSLKADYYVVLSSASGERRALSSKDEAAFERVVAAISDAITSRG